MKYPEWLYQTYGTNEGYKVFGGSSHTATMRNIPNILFSRKYNCKCMH